MTITSTRIPSSLDGELLHMRYIEARGTNRPLLVALHTWSIDYTEPVFDEYAARCRERDWHLVFPDFRGANTGPSTCASDASVNDVLDVVAWAKASLSVDHDRVYLTGADGGGLMALVAAAHAPAIWTAVSAWVPISDLARWHAETAARNLASAEELETVCGGRPGVSAEVDRQYASRSPLNILWRAHIVPVDINAGIHDGHRGNSVPVGQSIRAFNKLAHYVEEYEQMIGEDAIAYIEEHERIPDWCEPGDTFDPAYPAEIHLRRTSKLTRITIFEGGHEILYDAAFHWFDAF